ncbi:4,5-DOPA dioxygenase extradiol [Chloroflexota bacterium]
MKGTDLQDRPRRAGAHKEMPVLFMGHGSPMNAIEDNEFSQAWKQIGQEIPTPRAILCISAHWLTQGTAVTAMARPRTIHDFGGFPPELYAQQYPAPGAPEHARLTRELVSTTQITLDDDWGLDHGTWSVLMHLFPQATIPTYQLSIDYHKPPLYHYDLASELKPLRSQGVLIFGSGNIVHNLRLARFEESAYDWATAFDGTIERLLLARDDDALVDYPRLGDTANLAVPTPDHYYPLLYALGATARQEAITFYAERVTYGAISMRSAKIGA